MYSARISRKSPALFVILIDQSGSMEEPTSLYGRTVSKAEAVAATVNMLLGELLQRRILPCIQQTDDLLGAGPDLCLMECPAVLQRGLPGQRPAKHCAQKNQEYSCSQNPPPPFFL